jgi:hypothetical protein
VSESGAARIDGGNRRDGLPSLRATARRERLRDRIRAMRAWYLTRELSLDDSTAGRLFPLLGRFDDRMEELHQRGVALQRALRREMDAAQPDRAALDQLVNDLLAHYDDLYRAQRERIAAARKVVTPEQGARLLLILPRIDDAIRRQIRRAMRGPSDRDGHRDRLRKNGAGGRGDPPPGVGPDPFGDQF